MSSENLKEFAMFAGELAESARKVSIKHFRNLESVEYKKDGSPVTVADHDTEEMVRQMIADRYPDHTICACLRYLLPEATRKWCCP